MFHVLAPVLNIRANVFAAAALLVVSVTLPVSAGVITHSLGVPAGPNPVVVGPGLGIGSVPIISTSTPNNDNVPNPGRADNNIGAVLKRFDSNGDIDIVFTVAPSGGTTEYQISEFVDNHSGHDWKGYRLELGFGVGDDFVLAPIGGGLDFDSPEYDTSPTSSAMVVSLLTPNVLEFSGMQGAGAQMYSFRIDVPDLSTTGFAEFTLRQSPLPNPEPSTMVMASIAGLAIVGYGFRRRRAAARMRSDNASTH